MTSKNIPEAARQASDHRLQARPISLDAMAHRQFFIFFARLLEIVIGSRTFVAHLSISL